MRYDNLHSAIMKLPHTGAKGFEGFMRDILAEVTGQSFGIIKSGPQGGVDVLSEPGSTQLTVGLEGKHYKENTRLPFDQLKAKLFEAATSLPALDFWLLAATRKIDPAEKRELSKIGAVFGVEAVVFDWHDGVALPPPLATLVASAPNAAAAHLGSSKKVWNDLAKVTAHPHFASERHTLVTRLTSPDIGYAATGVALRSWLDKQMTDRKTARLAFDSYADLLGPGAHRVDRAVVNDALQSWWENSCESAGALLGQEGAGKTWGALGWWHDHAAALPVTVVIPARDVRDDDGPALVARALHKATSVRDVPFWNARIRRWLNKQEPVLLVIIDGLNQQWTFNDWSRLILSLTSGVWEGKTRVLLTCRPDHWQQRLRGLEDLLPPPAPVNVPYFSDTELDYLLASYDLALTDFDASLVPLLKVPRLCHVAIQRRRELEECGDITAERLIYEDWRYRSPTSTTLSHEEFRQFVSKLAAHVRSDIAKDISREKLLETLIEGSGYSKTEFQGVISEIVDGGWLQPTGKPHHFQLQSDKLPFALGLALLDELKDAADQQEADERISATLEPFQGADVAVAILRTTATLAMIDANVTLHVRRAIITVWLGSQNLGNRDFNAFWRLIPSNPEVVLDVAEQIWFGEHPSGREDEMIIKGFANAQRWENVAEALERRLTRWLSRYWLDPMQGAIIGEVADDEKAAARRDATKQRAGAWLAIEKDADLGFSVTPVDHAHQSWGTARAMELLSWQPRASFTRAIAAWAITRAIMGVPYNERRLAWVLRWNPEDPEAAEAAILRLAEKLLSINQNIARDAAALLLDLQATPAAMKLLQEKGDWLEPPSIVPWFDDAVDEEEEGILTWRTEDANKWPRCETSPLDAAMGLKKYAPEPLYTLNQTGVQVLRQLGEAATLEQLWNAAQGHVVEDGGFEEARLALARWAPDVRCDMERRRFAVRPIMEAEEQEAAVVAQPTANPSKISLWTTICNFFRPASREPSMLKEEITEETMSHRLSKALPVSLLLLDREEAERWASLAREERTNAGSYKELHPGLQAAALYARNASEQIAIMAECPSGPPTFDVCTATWTPLEENDYAELERHLHQSDVSRVIAWLHYLLHVWRRDFPAGWPALVLLLTHRDVAVRAMTMEIAAQEEDVALADELERSGWNAAAAETREEVAYGSLLLTYSTGAAAGGLTHRVHGEVLGLLAERFPSQPVYLTAFADYVERELDCLFSASSRSFPRSLLDRVRGWDALAAGMPQRIKAALAPMIQRQAQAIAHVFVERFPLLDSIQALAKSEPQTATELINMELEDQIQSNFRSGEFHVQAMRLPSPEGDKARETSCREANDDQKLLELAVAAQRYEKLPWLLSKIDADLNSRAAGSIARGLVLAGFLAEGPEASGLWGGRLKTPPASGWLTEVHSAAKHVFEMNKAASHWLDRFVTSPSEEDAFAALELLLPCVDQRITLPGRLYSLEVLHRLPRERFVHWRLRVPAINRAIKIRTDALKKKFLLNEPPGRLQYPMRH